MDDDGKKLLELERNRRLVLADQLGALEHPERTRLDPSLR